MNRLIARSGLRMELAPCVFIPAAPGATNIYTVVLKHKGRLMKIPQADRKRKTPSIQSVLDALLEDTVLYDRTGTFEAWCQQFGCEPGDDLAVREYRQVSWYASAIKRLLGHDLYTKMADDWIDRNRPVVDMVV